MEDHHDCGCDSCVPEVDPLIQKKKQVADAEQRRKNRNERKAKRRQRRKK